MVANPTFRAWALLSACTYGGLFCMLAGSSFVFIGILGVESPWAILLPQYLFAIGHGIHQPCGQAGAVGPFPEKAGTAASLSGFAMTLAALGVGVGLGATLDRTVFPLTLGVGGFSVALALVAWTLVQRHGEPAAKRRPLTEARPA